MSEDGFTLDINYGPRHYSFLFWGGQVEHSFSSASMQDIPDSYSSILLWANQRPPTRCATSLVLADFWELPSCS